MIELGSSDFTQWEDFWAAMALMVVMGIAFMALLSVFLLWVWVVAMVLGLVDHQDLRRDPRYVCLKQ